MTDAIENMTEDLRGRDFVVFVGAGLPRPTGVKDWKGLMLALNSVAPVSGLKIKELEPFFYPEAAQMMYESLERQGRVDEYYSTIQEALESSQCSWHSVQWNIACACSSIVTTNLDTTFEDAINARLRDGGRTRCCEFQVLGGLCFDNLRKSNHITYLHGRRGSREIVLKTADYVKHYPSLNGGKESELEKMLSHVFIGRTAIVFTGVSFSDRYLLRTFERAFEKVRSEAIKTGVQGEHSLKVIKHYAVMEQAIDKPLREQLSRDENKLEARRLRALQKMRDADALEKRLGKINIEIVRYEYDQHKELDRIFEAIAKRPALSQDKRTGVPAKE